MVYLPLRKMMEFVSWDDDIPNWMEKTCSKPPASFTSSVVQKQILWIDTSVVHTSLIYVYVRFSTTFHHFSWCFPVSHGFSICFSTKKGPSRCRQMRQSRDGGHLNTVAILPMRAVHESGLRVSVGTSVYPPVDESKIQLVRPPR